MHIIQRPPVLMRQAQHVVINDIILDVEFECISHHMRKRLREGRYEILEANLIPQLLDASDSLLELGGGIGYLSSLLYRLGKCRHLVVVEAHPELIPVIHKNHSLNSVAATVIHGLVGLGDSSLPAGFFIRDNFWASSFFPPTAQDGKGRLVEVKRISLSNLLREHNITAVICDIEGGEIGLFGEVDLSRVQKIVVEQHVSVIGEDGVDAVRRQIADQGLSRCEELSFGKIDVFLRPNPSPLRADIN